MKYVTFILATLLLPACGRTPDLDIVGIWGGRYETNLLSIVFDTDTLHFQNQFSELYDFEVEGNQLTVTTRSGHTSTGIIVNAHELIFYTDYGTSFTIYRLTPSRSEMRQDERAYNKRLKQNPHVLELSHELLPYFTPEPHNKSPNQSMEATRDTRAGDFEQN